MFVGDHRIELALEFRKPPVSNLATPRLQRLPDSLAIVYAIRVERAVALVSTSLATADAEVLARPQVPAETMMVV